MTKEEIESRIDALWADVVANKEENYWLENEIEKLEEMLDEMENK